MRRLLIALAVIAAFACVHGASASDSVDLTLYETGHITNYFNQYWVVNVEGDLTVDNPTPRDLYEVSVKFDIGSLSVIDVQNTSYISAGLVHIPRIPANTTVHIPYNIVGISLVDPTLAGKGVLYTGLTKFPPIIYSDTFGQLKKASLEDANYTGRPGRLITVELNNPSGFQFTVNSLRVIKTPSLDPNQVIQEWALINDTSPVTISPDQVFVRDILDLNSADGLVYWLQADVFISKVRFIDMSNVTRYTQENLSVPPEFLNYTANDTSNESNRSFVTSPILYLHKIADQQLVLVGQPLIVSIIANNYAQKLITFDLTDALPAGFQFVSGEGWTLHNTTLSWHGTVSSKNAVVPSYTIVLNDTGSAGYDFLDAASATYDDNTVYSNTVPFIRQFVPSQKIYVQKKLRFEGTESVAVTIDVQNLGSTPVNNLILKEYLQDADVFSQISPAPDDKGIWTIPTIAAGDSYEATYYTTRSTQTNFLPNLYGVPSTDVLRSLVLDNVISSAWEQTRTTALEVIGVLLVVCLPILYFFLKPRMGPRGGGSGAVKNADASAPKVDETKQ